MKLRELGADELPREKMLEKGPEALTNSELIAIMLRTGTGATNVLDLSRALLRDAGGSIVMLSTFSTDRLSAVPGIGPAKAVTLAAAFELGRRFAMENAGEKPLINSAADVVSLMIPLLKGKGREECWMVFLSRSKSLIRQERLSLGSEHDASVGVRHIVSRALELKAAAAILVHNHPAGNPHPSRSDIRLTEHLKKTLDAVDIDLLDHIILSDNSYYSFCDEIINHI